MVATLGEKSRRWVVLDVRPIDGSFVSGSKRCLKPILEGEGKNQRQRLLPKRPIVLTITNTEFYGHLFTLHLEVKVDVG